MPRKHGPVTVVRILEGEFGHPKMWTFGLTETDFVNIEKLIEESFKHPLMDYNNQAVRDRLAAGLWSLILRVLGVSYLYLSLQFIFSHACNHDRLILTSTIAPFVTPTSNGPVGLFGSPLAGGPQETSAPIST